METQDTDFYCSFTRLPHLPETNLEELPFTLRRPQTPLLMQTALRRGTHPSNSPYNPPSPTRSTSLSSSKTKSSALTFKTLWSRSSISIRKRSIVQKVRSSMRPAKRLLRKKSGRRGAGGRGGIWVAGEGEDGMIVVRKTSTLDFRCIGTEYARRDVWWEDHRRMWDDVPRIKWSLPEDDGEWWRGIA